MIPISLYVTMELAKTISMMAFDNMGFLYGSKIEFLVTLQVPICFIMILRCASSREDRTVIEMALGWDCPLLGY